MHLRLALFAIFAAFSAATAWGQTVTETFDAGIPATWSIIDNHFFTPGVPDFSAFTWTTNTAEAMGNYTNGTPSVCAAASSHNHPGQYDISLLTPKFKLNGGAGGTNLNYDLNYYRVDAAEYFDTNLSIKGGPWITMIHSLHEGAPYSTGPPRVSVGISLPFFGAAIGDTCQVEFRYYSTFLLPMVHNEYVEIDNVRTPTPIPEPMAGLLALLTMMYGVMRRRSRSYDAAVNVAADFGAAIPTAAS